MKHDVRAAIAGAELFDEVGAAVAVGVAQGPDEAVLALGVEVAVGCDGEAAEAFAGVADLFADDEVVGIDEGAETGWERDATVVGVGRGEGGARGGAEEEECEGAGNFHG